MKNLLLRLVACWAFLGPLCGAELRWSHVPVAAYVGDSVTISFETSPNAVVSVGDAAKGQVSLAASFVGRWQATFPVRSGFHWMLQVDGTDHTIRCLGSRQESQRLSSYVPSQGLRGDDGSVIVLAAQRFERHKDRRYAVLKRLSRRELDHQSIYWPRQTAYGVSPLLNSLPTWQRHWREADKPSSQIFVCDVREEMVSWHKDEFAAVLSWVFGQQKFQQHVFFVIPPTDPFRYPALAPVRKAIAEVVEDTSATGLEFFELYDTDHWLTSPESPASG